MAKHFEISPEMKEKIGWQSKPWIYEVSRTSVRAFARGVGYTDPVYFDVEEARKAGYRDLPVPPTYVGTPVFDPIQSDPVLPIMPGSSPELNHGLKGLLDGGTTTEYLDTICAGDELTCVNKLVNLETKKSKALGTMLIVSNKTTYTNQDNKVVAIERKQGIRY